MKHGREGSIAELDLPRFLSAGFWNRSTGILRAVRRNLVIELRFRTGWIEDASSNATEDDLGQVLLQTGKISLEQLRLCLDTLTRGGALGASLVRLGFLTAQDLRWAQRRRGGQIIASLLQWREGTYKVLSAPPSPDGDGLHLNPLQIVVSVLLEEGDPEQLLLQLGGEDSALRIADDDLLKLGCFEVPEEYDLLAARLDGRTPLGHILRAGTVPPLDALRYLQVLQVFDLARLAGRVPLSEGPARAPRGREPKAGAESPRAPRRPPRAERRGGEEAADAWKPPLRAPAERAVAAPREESLVGEVMAHGTLVEVLFSVALLAAVFVAVLYMGRHYLAGLREDLDETRITRQLSLRESDLRASARAFPPGSARRVLSEVEFRILDREPPAEEPLIPSPLKAVTRDRRYRAALEAYRAGNYGQAARAWAAFLAEVPAQHKCVRLAEACTPTEIRDATGSAGPGFFLVPSKTGGPSCFQVLWGLFPSEETAYRALEESAGAGRSLDGHEIVTVAEVL